jgi:hypothetical protein
MQHNPVVIWERIVKRTYEYSYIIQEIQNDDTWEN